jgi:hypothetical protein
MSSLRKRTKKTVQVLVCALARLRTPIALPCKHVKQIDNRLERDKCWSPGLGKGVAVVKLPCAKERKHSAAYTVGAQNPGI